MFYIRPRDDTIWNVHSTPMKNNKDALDLQSNHLKIEYTNNIFHLGKREKFYAFNLSNS